MNDGVSRCSLESTTLACCSSAAPPLPHFPPQSLSIIHTLFHSSRSHLKLQLESFLSALCSRIVATPLTRLPTIAPQQEMALEWLLELCRLPEFALELFVNYDCDLQVRRQLCGSDSGRIRMRQGDAMGYDSSTLLVLP